MTNLFVPNGTAAALGLPAAKKKKTVAGMLGYEEDPAAAALRDTQNQTLTAGMAYQPAQDTSGLRQQATQQASQLGWDRAALESTLIGETDREAQDARERMARQYGIDPGGSQSGMSQRAFETLEGQVIGAKADIRSQLLQREGEEKRANLASTQGLYAALSADDLAGAASRLQASQAAGQQLSQDEQNLIAAYQTKRAAETDQAGLTGQYTDDAGNVVDTLAKQKQDFDMLVAKRGYVNTPVNFASLGVDKLQDLKQPEETQEQWLARIELTENDLRSALYQRGIEWDSLPMTTRSALMAGETVNIAMVPGAQALAEGELTGTYQGEETLAKIQQDINKILAEAELTGLYEGSDTLTAIRDQFERDITEAALTGTYNDADTLAAIRQRAELALAEAGVTGQYEGQDTLAAQQQAFEQAITEAEVTGMYEDTDTLAALQQNFNQLVEQAGLTGMFEDAPTLEKLKQDYEQLLGMGEVTGYVETPMNLTSLGLPGLSGLDSMQEGETIDQWHARIDLTDADLKTALGLRGVDWDSLPVSTRQALMMGQTVNVPMRTVGQQDVDIREEDLASQIQLRLGELTGLMYNPDGTPMTDLDGNQLSTLSGQLATLNQRLEEAKLSGTLTLTTGEDVETLQSQLQEAQIEIQTAEIGLKRTELAQTQFQFLTQATGQIAVDGTLSAEDLGVDTTGVLKADGTIDMARFDQLEPALSAALRAIGMDPEDLSDGEILSLLRGESIKTEATQTLAAKQLAVTTAAQLVQNRQADAKLALDAQIAEAAATGWWDTVATLEQMRYNLSDQLERDEMNLKWTQQLSNQANEQASLTGVYGGGSIALNDLGFDKIRYNPDGTIDEAELDKFFMIADSLVQRFQARAGRQPTEAEVQALIRGQQVDLEGTRTIAQQQLDLQDAIQRAQLTGTMIDPVTGKNIQTLQAEQQTFDQQLEQQKLDFDILMQAAAQTGFINLGTGGVITAQDIGVDTTYTSKLNPAELMATEEWGRLKDRYLALTGQKLGDAQAISLLRGESLDTGLEDIRVQTVSARQADRQLDIQEGTALGSLYGQQTEAARQFDEQLALQTNLSTAEVAKIYADIEIADREMNQAVFEFASQSSLQFAELFGGLADGGGSITADQLGVASLEKMIPGETMDQWFVRVDQQGAARDALRATLTQLRENPTEEDIASLLQGGSMAVSGRKTMGALALASQISEQNLNRATDIMKFSEAHELDKDRFNQAVAESDRNYALTAKQVAQDFGLETDRFLLAKTQLDAELGGRLGFEGELKLSDLRVEAPKRTGEVTLSDIGFSPEDVAAVAVAGPSGTWTAKPGMAGQFQDLMSAVQKYINDNGITGVTVGQVLGGAPLKQGVEDAEYQQARVQYQTRVLNNFSMLAGRSPTADELESILAGEGVAIESTPTFAREQWLDTVNQYADAYGMDRSKFTEAIRQFDKNYEISEASNYAQLFGTDQDDPALHTIEYQKYLDAKGEFETTEEKRDTIWTNMLRGFGKPKDVTIDSLISSQVISSEELQDLRGGYVDAEGNWQSTSSIQGTSYTVDTLKMNSQDRNALRARLAGLDYDPTYGYRPQDKAIVESVYNDVNNFLTTFNTNNNAQIPLLVDPLLNGRMYAAQLRDFLDGKPISYGGTVSARDDSRAIPYIIDKVRAWGGGDITEETAMAILEGNTVSITTPSFGPEELASMAAFVNGHSYAVAENNKGSGLARLAGTAIGATVGALAAGAATGGLGAGEGAAMGANLGGQIGGRF